MKEWKRKSETEKKLAAQRMEEAGAGNQVRARTMALLPLAALMLSFPAFATGGTATGMESVTTQVSIVTSIVNSVFSLITGNAYLSTMMAFGLLGAGVWLFRRLKRSVR